VGAVLMVAAEDRGAGAVGGDGELSGSTFSRQCKRIDEVVHQMEHSSLNKKCGREREREQRAN